MSHPIRLIALDLDGTLLRSDKSISPANASAIRRAAEAGIHVVLASGRMHQATARYARQMDFPADSYIISYSGAMVRRLGDEQPIVERPVDAHFAMWLVRFAAESDMHLNYYLDDVLYAVKPDRWSELYERRTGCASEFVGDLTRFDGERPTKLIIIGTKEQTHSLEPQMASRFGGGLQILITDDEYLEFMDPSATKGHALQNIAARLGVPREQVMAMGDGNNDLSMLEWAGRGIAMANGRPALLERVKEHAPAADEDGVASVVNRLLG